MYKISIGNREYTEFELYNSNTLDVIPDDEIPKNINPLKLKLFNQDIFDFNENTGFELVHSMTSMSIILAGVLILDTKETYGKMKNKNLYKCIPDDKRLPLFLIPYENRRKEFSKKPKNIFITFRFENWNKKHPIGSITNKIGEVDELDSYFNYQLYCKSLHQSIQDFTKVTTLKLKEKTDKEYIELIKKTYNCENRENWDVITIDPVNSKDFDDAISIKKLGDKHLVSIYIANVYVWMDIMDLWSSFTDRVSTIYLPDKKRPMLPTILSDVLCSLQKNNIRFALTLDLYINNQGDIVNYEFKNTSIKVKKNFRYEEKGLFEWKDYYYLFDIVNLLNKKNKYVVSFSDSHHLIAYLMLLMNHISAQELYKNKRGIFRSIELNKDYYPPTTIPVDIQNTLKMYQSTGGFYEKFDEKLHKHEILNFENYVHISSPIRRLVDILNLIDLIDCCKITSKSKKAFEFYNKWTSKFSIEYINKSTRAIRKIQNDCNILKTLTDNTEMLEKNYSGYLFNRIEREDSLYQYTLYLHDIQFMVRYTTRFYFENYFDGIFRVFIFKNSTNFKQKIRVEMIDKI